MQYPESTIYWLALSRIPGLGPVALRQQWTKWEQVEQIWQNIGSTRLEANNYLDLARLELDEVVRHNIRILTLSDQEYPNSMRSVADISPVLYLKGQLKPQDGRSVGIVGSRHPSPYGVEVTHKLTQQLVGVGYTVVSGMAKGVDAVAHRAAIEAGGRTIAVWGSGLDIVYPADHRQLADQILQHGAIVSQFPLGTQAQTFTFPIRNKIIAALSQAIIVTEARAQSGSLLTAQAAIKYGRMLGAVPGSVYHIGSVGPHQLIKSGAKLVVDAADIVDTIDVMATAQLGHHPNQQPAITVTASEEIILQQLQSGPQHIDELIRQATQPAAEVVGALTMLEIKGLVKQIAPSEYLKVN